MKKSLFAGALILTCMFSQSANAQSILTNLLSGATKAAAESAANNATSSNPGNTGKEVLGSVLNSVVTTANENTSGTAGNILGNLIATVAGNVTTTSTSIVGTWTYSKPSVQFTTEDYLAQAGGAAIAEKLETKLASIYKLASIKPSNMTFTFDNKGNVTYSVGSIQRTGTYTFDKETMTINITTAGGAKIKSNVTVSGTSMLLTFDGGKLLTLMQTLGSRFSVLSTVSTIAASYQGMKVGFAFEKK